MHVLVQENTFGAVDSVQGLLVGPRVDVDVGELAILEELWTEGYTRRGLEAVTRLDRGKILGWLVRGCGDGLGSQSS